MVQTAEAPRVYPKKLSVYITDERLRNRIRAFASLRRWSESQAALYLMEQGLNAEQRNEGAA